MTFRGLFQVIKSNKPSKIYIFPLSWKDKIQKSSKRPLNCRNFFLKTALHLLHSNCFHWKMISHFYISSCRGWETSKKIKNNESGINVPNSWTCRTKNIRKNQKWYAQQSQITLFTLEWDTLYVSLFPRKVFLAEKWYASFFRLDGCS